MPGRLLSPEELPRLFSKAIVARCTPPTPNVTLNQQVVAELLTETLFAYHRSRAWINSFAGRFVRRIAMPVAAGISAWVAVALLAAVLVQLGPTVADRGLEVVSIAGIALCCDPRRIIPRSQFQFIRSATAIRRLSLGRIEVSANSRSRAWNLLAIAALMGLQTGLTQFAPGHAGLEIQGGFLQCALLTLDNVCHGLLLDLMELHQVELVDFSHSGWSATMFLAFRVAINLLVGLVVVGRYASRRLESLAFPSPDEPLEEQMLLNWLRQTVATDNPWRHTFGPEYAFLQILHAYLTSGMDEVCQLARLFPTLRIEPQLKDLIVDPSGTSLLP